MEGPLRQYINMITRWKTRYYVLHEGILIYCDKKGGPKRGSIHLQIATISTSNEDPLRIVINSGTKEIILKAAS
jgi:hypothetical protein